MTKTNTTLQTDLRPTVKPWCYRVGRTGAKTFGARENWPAPRGAAGSRRKHAKSPKGMPVAVEKLLLIAEAKAGGIEGRIAHLKLKALKMDHKVTAEHLCNKIADRLTRLHQERLARAMLKWDGSFASTVEAFGKRDVRIRVRGR